MAAIAVGPFVERDEGAKGSIEGRALLEQSQVNIRDLISSLKRNDISAINKYLDTDPRLANPSAIETSSLSPGAKHFMREFAQFAAVYYGRFPDPTETEPLKSLVGYLTDKEDNWTIIGMKDPSGKETVSIATGRTVGELSRHSSFGKAEFAWNEHKATKEGYEHQGYASQAFKARERTLNAGLANSEFDWPAKNLEDGLIPKNMIDRLLHQGHNGYGIWVAKGTNGTFTPLAYTQIDMDPSSFQGPCETLVLASKVRSKGVARKLRTNLDAVPDASLPPCAPGDIMGMAQKKDLINMQGQMQATIADNHAMFPESVRLRSALKEQGNEVFLIKADSPYIAEMLTKPVDRNITAELCQDLKYERRMLITIKARNNRAKAAEGSLSDEDREARSLMRKFRTRTLLDLADQCREQGADPQQFWKQVAETVGMSPKKLLTWHQAAEARGRAAREQ